MKRKKILYIGNALTHNNVTVTTIDILSTLLRAEGYEVIISSSVKNKMARFIDMLRSVYIHKRNVDTVLIDTYSTTNYWYAVYTAKLCRVFKIPYIPILHGGNLPERLKNNKQSAKKLFGRAKINIAPSQYLINAFEKEGYTNLCHIPNTISLTEYPFKLREKCKPVLLWVRSFATIYNPMMAVKVVQELQKLYPEASLTMVGPIKDESFEECNAFAKAHKLPVQFTGKLSKKEWISLSETHDIFINTTNFDNMPVSIIEAMALGLPIVSTNVGGIPFLIDDKKNGIISPPKNVSLFVDKITQLIENSENTKKISEQARIKAESYDWEHVKIPWNKVLS